MGTVERRTWWKGTETRPLCFLGGELLVQLIAFLFLIVQADNNINVEEMW